MTRIPKLLSIMHPLKSCGSVLLRCLMVGMLTISELTMAQGTADVDGDGIANTSDLCPGTASGETVDEQGCSDNDYRARDKAALVALYNATNGDMWSNNTGWLVEEEHCLWFGIECVNGRVVSLVLINKRLSGSIPPELGNLTALTSLRLSTNQLAGSIPPELGTLTALTFLDLGKNQLSGGIPPELGHLVNLDNLRLNNNLLSGAIPSELGNLISLTYLELSFNQLSGNIPSTLGHLSKLTHLLLEVNQLSGSIPSELGNLTALNILRLSSNQLTSAIPAELGNLTNLTMLVLRSNQLSGNIPRVLGNLVNLTDLSLFDNQLSGTVPPELGDLTALTHLRIYNNRLSGSIPLELSNLTSLIFLGLGDNQLSGVIPPQLGKLTKLTNLYLGRNQLSGSIPVELGGLISLNTLSLESNQLSGGIPLEFANLRNLRSLSLSDNQLSEVIDESLGTFISAIFRISLGGNVFSCPYPSGLVDYFSSIGEPCVPDVIDSDGDGISDEADVCPTTALGEIVDDQGCSKTDYGRVQDKAALVALYNATNGQSWIDNTGWLTDQDYCTWRGVTCVASMVTGISLASNQLSGTLPSELGNLTNLNYVDLSNNQLSGGIPLQLTNLLNMTVLDLSDNQLSGLIGEDLGSYIANIQSFSLHSNNFDCPHPSALVDYFASINESCIVTAPLAVSIARYDYDDRAITLLVTASNGGSPILSYTATCTSGDTSVSATSTTNRIEVMGLTNGTAYTCTVMATNALGTSQPSLPTAPIKPEAVQSGLPIWLLQEAVNNGTRQSGPL